MTSPPPDIWLDHLAVAATSLDHGVRVMEDVLGVPFQPGGQHFAMGTHNRLLSLGPDLYLEVIAIDPEAPAPGCARWFDLDRFAGPPRLQSWIVAVADIAQAPAAAGLPVALARGDLRWQMAVPESGRLPCDGVHPAFIAWQDPGHPAARLTDRGVRLRELTVTCPAPEDLRFALPGFADPRVKLAKVPPKLRARFATPRGEVTL